MTEFCPDCGEEYGDCTCGKKEVEKPTEQTQLNDGGGGFLDKIMAIAEKASAQPLAPQNPMNIEVKNLIVSSVPIQEMVICAPPDIIALAKRRQLTNADIEAIIWHEEGLALALKDRSTRIRFELEIDETARAFFKRKESRFHRNEDDYIGVATWEGDCQPVKFTKTNLIKFISKYKANVPDEVNDAIKKLTLKESRHTETIMLEDDVERMTEEERSVTNLPKKFKITMPFAYGVEADLEFEARVVRDNYGKGRPTIELECVNSRQLLQDVMQSIISQFPSEIPRYYGRLDAPSTKER